MPSNPEPLHVLVAGGGIAGLEALLGLRAMAGDRVRLTLVAPDPDFVYRPLAVAAPFSLGRADRVPLARFAEEASAELVAEAVVAVDDDAGTVRLGNGATLAFDALLLAPGGRAVAGVEGATTWTPDGDPERLGGLLRDIEEGYTKRLAVVVPPGATWPLPAYELALLIAGEARDMGQPDVEVTLVTPEHVPLALFGETATAAIREELRWAGVQLETGAVARMAGGELVLEPRAARLAVDRVLAVPRILGPALAGVPADEDGFVLAGDDARVDGARRTWAAGDGVRSPVKFGGIATHQARRAAVAIAGLAGVEGLADPGEPVLHGRLLVGHRARRLLPGGDREGAPLWWPAGKVAGEHLPRWLAEHGVAPAPAEAPDHEGIAIRRPVRVMSAEARYLHDLARQFHAS